MRQTLLDVSYGIGAALALVFCFAVTVLTSPPALRAIEALE